MPKKIRKAKIRRKTKETNILVDLNVDGTGKNSVQTDVGFFDHMMSAFAKHGFFDLKIEAKGDLHIDEHHTVEDVGIALGEAFKKALGDKHGMARHGHGHVPLDEAYAEVILDVCGREYLVYNIKCRKQRIGTFSLQLIEEFFRGFTRSSGTTLHIHSPYGKNFHHIYECVFKAFGKAMDEATKIDPRVKGVRSTKGSL